MEKCNLSNTEISRYSRQLILPQFGVSGQLKLRASRVLIVGCGGLGCPAAVYLAAAGVGTIGLLDDDVVEMNNLHRQTGHSEETIGQPKAISLANRCRSLNSSISVIEHVMHLNCSNAVSVIRDYDVVLDCTDNLATRYLINDACAVFGPKPLVSGSALRLEGQMTVYFASGTSGRAACFRCLFPVPPPAYTVHGCSEAGVFGVVPGIIGTMQAAEAIKLLTGVGAIHSGRLFILDIERNLTRTVQLRKPRPECPTCGENAVRTPDKVQLTDYPLFCGAPDHDKPRGVNMQQLRDRITVQKLHEWRQAGLPILLVDIRPEVEVDICRLPSCLHFPVKQLMRDSVIASISNALDEQLRTASNRPFPIVLLCHRGNKSSELAPLLGSALAKMRLSGSQAPVGETDLLLPDLTEGDGNQAPEKMENCPGTGSPQEFVVCDVAGGLAAWAAEIDPDFPVY